MRDVHEVLLNGSVFCMSRSMNLEGFNGENIFLDPNTLSSTVLKKNKEMLNGAPPAPPPLPPGGLSNLMGPKKINVSDLTSVKLKKVNKNTLEKKKEEYKDLRIPTQEQLLDKVKILKKI